MSPGLRLYLNVTLLFAVALLAFTGVRLATVRAQGVEEAERRFALLRAQLAAGELAQPSVPSATALTAAARRLAGGAAWAAEVRAGDGTVLATARAPGADWPLRAAGRNASPRWLSRVMYRRMAANLPSGELLAAAWVTVPPQEARRLLRDSLGLALINLAAVIVLILIAVTRLDPSATRRRAAPVDQVVGAGWHAGTAPYPGAVPQPASAVASTGAAATGPLVFERRPPDRDLPPRPVRTDASVPEADAARAPLAEAGADATSADAEPSLSSPVPSGVQEQGTSDAATGAVSGTQTDTSFEAPAEAPAVDDTGMGDEAEPLDIAPAPVETAAASAPPAAPYGEAADQDATVPADEPAPAPPVTLDVAASPSPPAAASDPPPPEAPAPTDVPRGREFQLSMRARDIELMFQELDRLLAEVPADKISEFAASNEFAAYRRLVEHYELT